jgi:hypothetical protein
MASPILVDSQNHEAEGDRNYNGVKLNTFEQSGLRPTLTYAEYQSFWNVMELKAATIALMHLCSL